MKFKDLLKRVRDVPIFDTGFVSAGEGDPHSLRVQLSRWVTAKKLIRLRRGLYTLAPPYQSLEPHPFEIANRVQPGSYVSLQSALAYWGHIPDITFAVTSVGPGRPEQLDNDLGTFAHHHFHADLLYGFEEFNLGKGRKALVACAEKALLDLIHLTPRSNSLAYLQELRLQAIEELDMQQLEDLALRSNRPKWILASKLIQKLARKETL